MTGNSGIGRIGHVRPAACLRAHGLDHLDIAQHRLIEGDLVDAGADLARARRHAVGAQGAQPDDQRIRNGALARQRHQIGVGGEAAVPVGAPVDGDRVMDGGQARRSQHRLDRELAAPEQARAAGCHVGGGDQQLGAGARAQQREIDVRLEQLAERIEAQRIEVVGREQARHLRQRLRAADAGKPGIVAQEIGDAGLRHRLPHGPELGAGARPAALGEARRQGDGIDGAGAGGADPADVEGLVLEQAIEHAPGEGAVRAAPLERQIEAPLSPPEIQQREALIRPPPDAPRRASGPNHGSTSSGSTTGTPSTST